MHASIPLALLLIAHASAQAEDSPAVRVSELTKVVRNKTASHDQRHTAMDELLEIGWLGPRSLAGALDGELRSRRRTIKANHRTLLRDAGKRARAILAKRIDKKAQAAIDAARKVVLGNARGGSLTKQQIQQSSDPALAELREFLTLTLTQIWAADRDLQRDYSDLGTKLRAEADLFDYWSRAAKRLREHPDASFASKRIRDVEPPAFEARTLDTELRQIAVDATPMPNSYRKVLSRNNELREQIQPEEFAGIQNLNEIRILLGIRPQAIDVKLCKAARGHSTDMKEHDFFSHTSPIPGKRTPSMRAALEGTSGGAENIARGANTGVGAIRQWWYSPGHHKNMLSGAGRVGLGRMQRFWTQMFG